LTKDEEEEQRRIEDEKDLALVHWLRETGFHQLARDVNDIRFSHRILENQRWIDAHDFALSSDERMQESLEARLIADQSQLFDKAAAYNNIVVSLGYAGFFAIWNFTQDSIREIDNLLVAVLLGSSLLIFIFWTLITSFHNAIAARRIGKAVALDLETREERVDALEDAKFETQKSALKLQRFWPFVFALSVGTGFSAGLLLIYILAGKMLGFEASAEVVLEYFRSQAGQAFGRYV
jgi:hypothetical protein